MERQSQKQAVEVGCRRQWSASEEGGAWRL